jgi:hypothetical protein
MKTEVAGKGPRKRKKGGRSNGPWITKVSSLQMAGKLEHKYLPQVWASLKRICSTWQERQECGHKKLDEHKRTNCLK